MAYNTNNPVGSTDPRDLFDNAGNMDKFENGPNPFYPDRFGVQKLSRSGMIENYNAMIEGQESAFNAAQSARDTEFATFLANSGFVSLGNYASGIEFTRYNEYMARGGFFYRPAPSSIPFTTSGTWTGVDEDLFVLFSQDDVLRQDLANSTDPAKGAGIPSYNPSLDYPEGSAGKAIKNAGTNRVLYAESFVELNGQTPPDGTQAMVRGCTFTRTSGTWIPTSPINPIIFGADPTATTDSAASIQAAASFCIDHGIGLFSNPDEDFLVESQVNLRYVPAITLLGRIVTDVDTFTPLLVGYSSDARVESTVEIKEVLWRNRPGTGVDPANLPNFPNLRIVGCKNTEFRLGNIDYVQIYADTDDTATSSVAYCNFYPQQIEKLELTTNPTPAGSTVQWINENKFWGGRIRRIILSGTYGHNHNHWYAPTIETNGVINMQVGESNRIMQTRLEGGGIVITFAAGTPNNIVTQSWTNTPRDGIRPLGADVTVSDSGINNIVIRDQQSWMDRVVMFSLAFGQSLESASGQLGVNSTGLTKSGKQWQKTTGTDLYESLPIPCLSGMGFDIQSDQSLWRSEIIFYDAAGAQVTSASDPLLLSSSSYAWAPASNSYVRGSNFANIPSPPMVLTNTGYVKLILRSGASTTGVNFNGIAVIGLFKKGSSYRSVAAAQPKWI